MRRNKKITIKIIVILIPLSILALILFKIKYYKISGDFASSGADRKYQAVLIFFGNSLISGHEFYTVGEGAGCTSNCEKTIKCIYKNKSWIYAESGSECTISNYNYNPTDDIDKKQLEEKIKQGVIKPSTMCGHGELCYKKFFTNF
ncbi:MAG: hypothetical protein U0469_00765 [Candidatus Paceibacterota bacterium]|jgi:hypothetical protein